jgi:hypothetical protein
MSIPDSEPARAPSFDVRAINSLIADLQRHLVTLGVALRANLAERERPVGTTQHAEEAAQIAERMTLRMALAAFGALEARYAELLSHSHRLGQFLASVETAHHSSAKTLE